LSILEASGQIVLLEPWFSNRTKSIGKSPKLAFSPDERIRRRAGRRFRLKSAKIE